MTNVSELISELIEDTTEELLKLQSLATLAEECERDVCIFDVWHPKGENNTEYHLPESGKGLSAVDAINVLVTHIVTNGMIKGSMNCPIIVQGHFELQSKRTICPSPKTEE